SASGSSARWPGSRGSITCARRFPSRACSIACVPERTDHRGGDPAGGKAGGPPPAGGGHDPKNEESRPPQREEDGIARERDVDLARMRARIPEDSPIAMARNVSAPHRARIL